MALINVREVYPGVHLGLWQIGESVNDFLESYPWMKVYIKDLELYKSEGRKLEFLAVRALLREMLLLAGYSEDEIMPVMKDISSKYDKVEDLIKNTLKEFARR